MADPTHNPHLTTSYGGLYSPSHMGGHPTPTAGFVPFHPMSAPMAGSYQGYAHLPTTSPGAPPGSLLSSQPQPLTAAPAFNNMGEYGGMEFQSLALSMLIPKEGLGDENGDENLYLNVELDEGRVASGVTESVPGMSLASGLSSMYSPFGSDFAHNSLLASAGLPRGLPQGLFPGVLPTTSDATILPYFSLLSPTSPTAGRPQVDSLPFMMGISPLTGSGLNTYSNQYPSPVSNTSSLLDMQMVANAMAQQGRLANYNDPAPPTMTQLDSSRAAGHRTKGAAASPQRTPVSSLTVSTATQTPSSDGRGGTELQHPHPSPCRTMSTANTPLVNLTPAATPTVACTSFNLASMSPADSSRMLGEDTAAMASALAAYTSTGSVSPGAVVSANGHPYTMNSMMMEGPDSAVQVPFDSMLGVPTTASADPTATTTTTLKPPRRSTGESRRQRPVTGERRVKTFTCAYQDCSKTFSKSSSVRSHEMTHTDKRPYLCDDCQKPFGRNHDLQRHMTTHKPEKEYQCDYCNVRFSRQDALHRHRRNNPNCAVTGARRGPGGRNNNGGTNRPTQVGAAPY
ncbi:hypothetical protein IWQ60_006999 [Tieghemiomyces parasiticus]|uniref:C2H2-type domain-containing protein n=1 Tax=Tieghemiomyces parasiticus TaxID=78921 RepID=A0A9W8DW78_9FUNG|nr:hypothetical protein IWQ60_006999 [Tieghemiomyces parasiticus]